MNLKSIPIIGVTLLIILIISGCSSENDPVFCTKDAKECFDGSTVTRVAPDCEFEKCPSPEEVCDWENENKRFVSGNAEECKELRFSCEKDELPFSDFCGCGCETPKDPPPEPKESKTFCTPEQRNVDACIEIYQPVCGFNPNIQCITTPCNPTQETFSNSCFACQNELIEYYIDGECQ